MRRGDGAVVQLGHGEQGQSGCLCPRREPWDNPVFPVRRQSPISLCSSACCLGLCPLSISLHLPNPSLWFPSTFSSTHSISHALLQPLIPSHCQLSLQCPVTRAKLGPCRGVFSPSLCKSLFESPKPSWCWDFSKTPSFPRHTYASSLWLHEELGRRQGDLRGAEPIPAHGSHGSMFQAVKAAASGSKGAQGKGLGHGWQGHGHPCSNNHRNM